MKIVFFNCRYPSCDAYFNTALLYERILSNNVLFSPFSSFQYFNFIQSNLSYLYEFILFPYTFYFFLSWKQQSIINPKCNTFQPSAFSSCKRAYSFTKLSKIKKRIAQKIRKCFTNFAVQSNIKLFSLICSGLEIVMLLELCVGY